MITIYLSNARTNSARGEMVIAFYIEPKTNSYGMVYAASYLYAIVSVSLYCFPVLDL